jgi:hypothetical protein
LINYWPVERGVMADVIGLVNTTSQNPKFTSDRFGNANGAILADELTSGWQIPGGAYFSGDYTITVWVKNVGTCSNTHRLGESREKKTKNYKS